jgi:hypothetical protein
MATSYDYRYHEVGQAEGTIQNTASTSVVLSGLTAGLSYEIDVRVRESDGGVVYLGLWSSLVFEVSASVGVTLSTINPSVTLNTVTIASGTPPIYVDLGVIAPSINLNPITIVGAASLELYDLSLLHVLSGTSTQVLGIGDTTHSLTGLTEGEDYEVKVRSSNITEGAAYPPTWSNSTLFTAGALSSVIVNLENLSTAVTINPITQYLPPSDIYITLGTVTPAVTVNSISLPPPIGTYYMLEVNEVGVGITYVDSITGQDHLVSGLTVDASYIVRVRAYVIDGSARYYSPWSDPTAFTASELHDIYINLGVIAQNSLILGAMDYPVFPLVMENFDFTNETVEGFRVFGRFSHKIQSMSVTINGSPMGHSFEGFDWTAVLQDDVLQINQVEELDGPQPLTAGNTVLEVN